MISIICPCFNSGDTIDGVINSLLSQVNTKFKYEVIFIDDGSKDNTISIIKNGLKRLESKGITSKIHLSTHKGPGAARNQGINISNYDKRNKLLYTLVLRVEQIDDQKFQIFL